MKTLVFTCGDINGIGPEITIKAINKLYNPKKRKIVFICPANVFEKNIPLTNPNFHFNFIKRVNSDSLSSSNVSVLDIGNYKIDFGREAKTSGKAASEAIQLSYQLAKQIKNSAVITSPISKASFQLAGIEFPGQTEFYAKLSGTNRFMMLFLSRKLICGLATIHIPLVEVASTISKNLIKEKIEIFSLAMEKDLNRINPRIAVLGLNPHAGENGRIGIEEKTIIIPSIKEIKNKNVTGPFVPDAFFGTKQFNEYDAVLGMYHDQVLIPFKLLNFDKGVNYSAGLNIIRTSPDHGTAFDIAGLGIANPASMIEAAIWAEKILINRSRYEAR